MNNLTEQIVNDVNNKIDLYSYFRNLIRTIGSDAFLRTCNFDVVLDLLNQKYSDEKYKLFVCILEDKKNINNSLKYILNNERLFNDIFKNNSKIFSIFNGIDYDTLKQIILKIECNNLKYSSKFINNISKEVQLDLLYDNLNWGTFKWLLPNLDNEVHRKFYSDDKRAMTYIEENINSGELINLINNNYKFSEDILFSNIFFEKIKSSSLIEFRNTINKLIENNYHENFFESKLEKYEKELLGRYNPNIEMFIDYKDIDADNFWEKSSENSNKYILSDKLAEKLFPDESLGTEEQLKDNLKKISNMKLSEIIIDLIFKDNYYNVIRNINEMLRYNQTNPNIIDNDFIELYQTISKIDSLNYNDKMKLYSNLKGKDISSIFYSNLRAMKDHSYNNIVSKLLDINSNQGLLNKQLSDGLGTNIYELNGEKFNLMIRCSERLDESRALRRNCYSLISNDNISVIDPSLYCYGYKNIDTDNILHVFENDSFSTNIDDNTTSSINRIMTPEEINNYRSYSEIQIVNKKTDDDLELLKPDYYVVFDEITPKDIDESKRLNIPIVKINTKMYKDNVALKNTVTGIDGEKYIDNIYDEELANGRRL